MTESMDLVSEAMRDGLLATLAEGARSPAFER